MKLILNIILQNEYLFRRSFHTQLARNNRFFAGLTFMDALLHLKLFCLMLKPWSMITYQKCFIHQYVKESIWKSMIPITTIVKRVSITWCQEVQTNKKRNGAETYWQSVFSNVEVDSKHLEQNSNSTIELVFFLSLTKLETVLSTGTERLDIRQISEPNEKTNERTKDGAKNLSARIPISARSNQKKKEKRIKTQHTYKWIVYPCWVTCWREHFWERAFLSGFQKIWVRSIYFSSRTKPTG